MRIIGLDIGGANLKVADNDGMAASQSFALWKHPHRLADALQNLISGFPAADRFAVTMTGELADCFDTKADGVSRILMAVEQVANGIPISIWQTGAEFVSPAEARELPMLVAAANWHALATFCGRVAPQEAALLIDIGSTTTDIIPLLDGYPVPMGLTDKERLISGELVYTGTRRTPICALTPFVQPEALPCPAAAEWFATTLDLYLLLGEIPENNDDRDTANGKPATRSAAMDRMARVFCCDRTELSKLELESIAAQIADVQQRLITTAIERVIGQLPSPCRYVILSGTGHKLGRRAAACCDALNSAEIVSLPVMLGVDVASAACAFAVAKLAAERP